MFASLSVAGYQRKGVCNSNYREVSKTSITTPSVYTSNLVLQMTSCDYMGNFYTMLIGLNGGSRARASEATGVA